MVIHSPTIVTARPPVTDLALLHGFRICLQNFGSPNRIFETRLYEPVVGEKIVNTKCFRQETVSWRNHVHSVRYDALKLCQQLRIQTELEDGASSGLASQLGIDHFVRPVSEIAWSIDLEQNVGTSAPGAIPEVHLSD